MQQSVIHTCPVVWLDDVSEAASLFLDDLEGWARQCMAEEALPRVGDGHDQATYTTAWGPLLRYRASPDVFRFLGGFRDAIRDHFTASGAWHHGYWGRQEAHHGTEHTELFLGFLYRADPRDAETVRQFLDAAEHVGNWVPGIPPWFDWDTGLFRSMYLGTEEVREGREFCMNVADHLRCVTICLLAHEMSGVERYLELAQCHGRQWAEAIAAGDRLPAGLLPGGPVASISEATGHAYHGFAGMAGSLDDDLDRAENILASGGITALLELWNRTGEPVFLSAARRLLDVLVLQLGDPDAGAAADAVRTYRSRTGDASYDDAVRQSVARHMSHRFGTLGVLRCRRAGPRPRGIGKRNDKPEWLEDGEPRAANPILLAVAAEIDRDEGLAARALSLARAYFNLGRCVLTSDRHHGCGADSDSAVARGHGRENGAGMVTGVLEPLLATFDL